MAVINRLLVGMSVLIGQSNFIISMEVALIRDELNKNLITAAKNGDLGATEVLLARGASVNCGAAHWAAHSGQKKVLKVLVVAGAELNGFTIKDKTVLDFAKLCTRDDYEQRLVEKFIKKNGGKTSQELTEDTIARLYRKLTCCCRYRSDRHSDPDRALGAAEARSNRECVENLDKALKILHIPELSFEEDTQREGAITHVRIAVANQLRGRRALLEKFIVLEERAEFNQVQVILFGSYLIIVMTIMLKVSDDFLPREVSLPILTTLFSILLKFHSYDVQLRISERQSMYREELRKKRTKVYDE